MESKERLNLEEARQRLAMYNVDKRLRISIDWKENKEAVRMEQEEVYMTVLNVAMELKRRVPETVATVVKPIEKRRRKGWRIDIWLD